MILRHKAKDDLKTVDPILFELEQQSREDLSSKKKIKKTALTKLFSLKQISNGRELNRQNQTPVNVQIEDDGSEILEKIHKDDKEFLNRVEGLLTKNRVLPINKMFTVVHQLDEVLQNLGDTADELDTMKGNKNDLSLF